MSAIKSKNTKPELLLRKTLFSYGYRYRIHANSIPGHPDLWFRKYNVAVFVNGCFWHRHQGCKYAYIPKSRTEFWEKKFEQNVKRDQMVMSQLEKKGIRYLIVWECSIKKAIKNDEGLLSLINEVDSFFHSEQHFHEI